MFALFSIVFSFCVCSQLLFLLTYTERIGTGSKDEFVPFSDVGSGRRWVAVTQTKW